MADTATEEKPEAEVKEPYVHPPSECDCGGVPTRKRSRFLPGHDAQLKASLYRTIRDGDATDEAKAEAIAKLDTYGWPQPVPKKAKAVKTETNGEGETP